MSRYDYIIIGAGSAGCVLANRLSENYRVLLIEAGKKDNSWKIHMPAALTYNLCDDQYNWYYHTEAQTHMNQRKMYWPRGKVLGGSSSLNAMVYVRGHAYDYDRWQQQGAENWDYAHVLPYFKKSEKRLIGGDTYRGDEGFLKVTTASCDNPLHQAFIKAGQQAGYPITSDMNGYQQEGFGKMDMTIANGRRCSTAKAYLKPVQHRHTLTVLTQAQVTDIIIDHTTAKGITYLHKNQKEKAYADCGVILSGGAINSPQLLMLSGIGNANDLKKHNIDVKNHLPGVGQNLQDHLEIYVQQSCQKPITLYQFENPLKKVKVGLEWFLTKTGICTSTHLESGAFIRSREGVKHPDIQFHFLPSCVLDHGRIMPKEHAYQVHVGPMRATSKGYIKLRDSNPFSSPIIQPNYLQTETDRLEMRLSVKHAQEVFSQDAFKPYRGKYLAPNEQIKTDKEIDAFVREKADSAYHPSCTCKMGNDDMAVVDSNGKVHGIENLYVIDASIMPSIVSGNLNAPTIMIAEKCADNLLGKQLDPLSAPVYETENYQKQQR